MEPILKKVTEIVVKCPHYYKKLEHCPSSKEILVNKDFDRLLHNCTCSKYKECDIFHAVGEKAA